MTLLPLPGNHSGNLMSVGRWTILLVLISDRRIVVVKLDISGVYDSVLLLLLRSILRVFCFFLLIS